MLFRSNTERYVDHIRRIKLFHKRSRKPVYIGHPFRAPINYHLIEKNIDESVTKMTERPNGEYNIDELDSFFRIDLSIVFEAVYESQLPLEVNGWDDFRLRRINLPVPLQMCRAALRFAQTKNIQFIPGSDLHEIKRSSGARAGMYIPADIFKMLGVKSKDFIFLQQLL